MSVSVAAIASHVHFRFTSAPSVVGHFASGMIGRTPSRSAAKTAEQRVRIVAVSRQTIAFNIGREIAGSTGSSGDNGHAELTEATLAGTACPI